MKILIPCMMTLFAALIPASEAIIPSQGTEAHSQGDGAGAGWNYTGRVNNASAVFLGGSNGDYWVMTNMHAGTGDFNINGKSYAPVNGSGVQVGSADLLLYRIAVDEGDELTRLPNLRLSNGASGLTTDSKVVMIGYGGAAFNDEIQSWKVDSSTNPATWSTDPDAPGDLHSGYYFTNGVDDDSKRWGTNTIESFIQSDDMIRVTFSDTQGEGQAVTGDSGGGLFYFNEELNEWELAGIMTYISPLNGQPGNVVAFGQSTWALSMVKYSDEIYRIMGIDPSGTIPEPASAGLAALALLTSSWRRKRPARA